MMAFGMCKSIVLRRCRLGSFSRSCLRWTQCSNINNSTKMKHNKNNTKKKKVGENIKISLRMLRSRGRVRKICSQKCFSRNKMRLIRSRRIRKWWSRKNNNTNKTKTNWTKSKAKNPTNFTINTILTMTCAFLLISCRARCLRSLINCLYLAKTLNKMILYFSIKGESYGVILDNLKKI